MERTDIKFVNIWLGIIGIALYALFLWVLCMVYIPNKKLLVEYNRSYDKPFRIDKKLHEGQAYKRSAKYYLFGTCLEDGKRYTIDVTPQSFVDMQVPCTSIFNISYSQLNFYTGNAEFEICGIRHSLWGLISLVSGIFSIFTLCCFRCSQAEPDSCGWPWNSPECKQIRKIYSIANRMLYIVLLTVISGWIYELTCTLFV